MGSAANKLDKQSFQEFSLYDDLLIPVLTVDEEGTIRYFNSTMAGFLKLSPRKLRNKPVVDVINCQVIKDGALVDRCFREWIPVVSEETTISVEGGEIRDAIFKVIPHDCSDGSRQAIVTIQDISIERILHEKHRIQLDELKKKNEEIRKYSEGLEVLVDERTQELREAMDRSENLLLNILPKKVADRLKAGEGTIADRFSECSVLFVDIVKFTTISSDMDPTGVVEFLSKVFERFDELVEKHGVEKIKTIGDAYLVVSGVPQEREDHAAALCECALEMREELRRLSERFDFQLEARFGITSGPVVAGVVGSKKFAFDIWGDTVNVASRMESHGERDRIQISETTFERIKDRFACEKRGTIEVKGKGSMLAYWLDGKKDPS